MWYGDAVEIVLETESHSYYQIAVNPAGALVAGLVLGVAETAGAATVGASWTTLLLLAAAALTVVLRPRGVLAARS